MQTTDEYYNFTTIGPPAGGPISYPIDEVIYRDPDPSLLDRVFKVVGKRQAQTGFYVPAYYGAVAEEWEGAYLGSPKSVTVLRLVETGRQIYGHRREKRKRIRLGTSPLRLSLAAELPPSDFWEFLATQVEKVAQDE